MHASELDVHATMLLRAGKLLNQGKDTLKVLFQSLGFCFFLYFRFRFLDYFRHYLFGYQTNSIWHHLSIHVICLTRYPSFVL